MKDTLLTADEPHSSQQCKSVQGQQSSMKAFTTNEIVMKAEILWSIKSVNGSLLIQCKCCKGDLFKKIFSESEIASKFAFWKPKINYLLCLRITPVFKEKLLQKVKRAECENII